MTNKETQETVKAKLSPERWVIKSTAFSLSGLEKPAFYDLENDEWVSLAVDATKFKEPNIAQQILKQVCNGEVAEIQRYLQSPSEKEPAEHKLASDWVTIAYDEGSQNYLYESPLLSKKGEGSAVLQIFEPLLISVDKNEITTQCVMSVPPQTMDEFAIAWCKHRKLQGALGGPVGNEWGSPDCPWQ
jgi:hypothetical protein